MVECVLIGFEWRSLCGERMCCLGWVSVFGCVGGSVSVF